MEARIQVGPVTVRLVAEGDQVAKHHFNGGFEPETLVYWASVIKKNHKTIVTADVGAYTGIYAISAALIGARSLAFEPTPITFARLTENIDLNDAAVSSYSVALSDKKGSVPLMVAPHHAPLPSGASIAGGTNLTKNIGTVQTLPLDFMQLRHLGIMKIDAEGAEHLVIEGALKTISRCQPQIIAECLDPDAERRVHSLMHDLGYYLAAKFDHRNHLFLRR